MFISIPISISIATSSPSRLHPHHNSIPIFIMATQPPASQATAPSSKFKWDSFASELWHAIIANCTQRDQAAVALVSRRLHKIAEPLIYSKFSWVPDNKKIFPHISLSSGDITALSSTVQQRPLDYCAPPPYLLLRTILHRPDLAHHIKSAVILSVCTTVGLFWDEFDRNEGALSPDEFALCSIRINQLENIPHETWLEELAKGGLDVVTAVLISFLPCLKSINIRPFSGAHNGRRVFEAIRDPVNFFRLQPIKSLDVSVETIVESDTRRLGISGSRRYLEVRLSRLLDIPGLESLSVSSSSGSDGFWDFAPPCSQTLTSLPLPFSKISSDILQEILKGLPKLEVLDYGPIYYHPFEVFPSAINLSSALSQVSKTLKRLTLRLHVRIPCCPLTGTGLPWTIEGSIGSMKHFKQLKYFLLEQPITVLSHTYADIHLGTSKFPSFYSTTITTKSLMTCCQTSSKFFIHFGSLLVLTMMKNLLLVRWSRS